MMENQILHITTYANSTKKLKFLKKSAGLFNTDVNYIVKEGKWLGNITKIVEMYKIINSYNDDDIVVFIDAFDVLINSDKNEIIDKFKSLNCDVLLGAELNCFPRRLKKKMNEIMPKEIKNKYINSGGYMGYVKDIKNMLSWMNRKRGHARSDQCIMTKFFIKNHNKVNIKLDTKSLIFQNMHLILWDEIQFINGKLYNTVMKTTPCFIHFNGSAALTKTRTNIMPIILELLTKSIDNKSILFTLNDYEQLQINNKPKAVSQI